jgi:hypothetical protein
MLPLKSFYQNIWPVHTGYDLIRIGGTKDGSYLLPNVLDGIELCLSPGTAGMVDFELGLAESYGIPSLLCDPNEDIPVLMHPLMSFDRISIGVTDTNRTISMDSWMIKHGFEDASPLLLSMDIEGGEIDVINSLSIEMLARIRVATIEFHFLHLLHSDPNCLYSRSLGFAIERMRKYFDIVHFKPNNNCPFAVSQSGFQISTFYSCVELTFLNKQLRRRSPSRLRPDALPHFLDTKNVSDKPEADYSAFARLVFD